MLTREIAVDHANGIVALVDLGMLLRRSGVHGIAEIDLAIGAAEAVATKLNELLTLLDAP